MTERETIFVIVGATIVLFALITGITQSIRSYFNARAKDSEAYMVSLISEMAQRNDPGD